MIAKEFSVGTFEDEPDDLAHWLSQSAEDRLAGIELLRQQFFKYGDARPELCRVLEIADLPRDCSPTGGK